MAQNITIKFALEEDDVAYFRKIFRNARKHAAELEEKEIVGSVQALIERVRKTRKTPHFVREAVRVLEDLLNMLQDEDYDLPKAPRGEVLGALAYFANPHDLIPDQIPGLGFLDDAIMIKILEDEFRQELWGYRQFVKFRSGAEQRPWTQIAKSRLPERLAERRRKIRQDVDRKKKERRFVWW
ncbi:MAG: hypothetical protein DCC71_16380 [Proteobacteria bacterium]|nr:MAG: hypothetical protein DCC71_16380 [Pseudomonadota bacterium]